MHLRIFAACLTTSVLIAGPASADYYVIRNEETKECKVVEERPKEKIWIQIGDVGFATRDEAEKQITVICKDKEE